MRVLQVWFFALASIVLIMTGCFSQQKKAAQDNADTPQPFFKGPQLTFAHEPALSRKPLHEKAFHEQQDHIIREHWEQLVKSGRITDDHVMPAALIGTYGWYDGICDEVYGDNSNRVDGKTACSFGAYSFLEAAFEQAKHLYIIRGQMAEGSALLVDVGAGAFDKDIVGYTVPGLTYCSLHGGKLWHCGGNLFDLGPDTSFGPSKVLKFIDKFTVQLDHKAKYDAEMYGLTITPPDYVDMCNCSMPIVQEPKEKESKPCVQGGTLAPGESCSISIPIS